MKTTTVKPFMMIGLAVRTSNESGKGEVDIPQLWHQFLSQQMAEKIPSKTSESVYSVYTDYEGDHTKPYTMILGYRVASLDVIPEGLVGRAFSGGDYTVFTAKGKLEDGIVFKTWMDIWAADINRAFTADFEVYDNKVNEAGEMETDIFIAVR